MRSQLQHKSETEASRAQYNDAFVFILPRFCSSIFDKFSRVTTSLWGINVEISAQNFKAHLRNMEKYSCDCRTT